MMLDLMMRRLSGVLCAGMAALTLFAAVPASATKVDRIVSPGGIEAWLVSDPAVPLVAIEFAFNGGASQDPVDKLGLANMTASLLDEGAGDIDSAAFQQKMEEQAIELRFNVDRDHFRGSLRTLSERRAAGFDLLRLALTSPRFDSEAVERIRGQLAAELARESTSPNSIASKAWWEAAFPGHPYGRPQKGTPETLANIKADDLKQHARRVLARQGLKIAIVGDIEASEAGRVLDSVFGALPDRAELQTVAPVVPTGMGRRLVVTLDTPQAVVNFGTAGLARKHPDFIAAFVVNHILGGGSFTSRLYQEVREKRGLAYGVQTYLWPLERTALFLGGTQVRADRAGDSITIIEQEIRRMAEQGPTEDELEKAKDFLVGSYALRFDSSTKIASQLVQIQLDELGIDYIDKRNDQIRAVSLADARRVAQSLLKSGFLITIIGRPVGVTSTGPG